MILCFVCKMCGAKEYKESAKSVGYNYVYYQSDSMYLDLHDKPTVFSRFHYCEDGSLGIWDLVGSYPKED